ncbi:ArsR/SmtB family transcription factor [Deinococcus alpinitundrae]|uniref:ArsR/SmtB family transcription factor n=1 Tax=Deinococcus alpinitundrae TaxID=468913 RepID=UPI001379BAC4|nr:metalloregulator ArsR/SmtB family transcription factor [Deinococcus alpinitundrae]
MNVATFHALADPQRLEIVELLRLKPLTVGEIAAQLQLRQPQTSKHLRVLQSAGVIEMQADANRRICSLRPEAFRALDDWLTTFRQLWEERFDKLDGYLQRLQDSAQPPDQPPETTPPPPPKPGDPR